MFRLLVGAACLVLLDGCGGVGGAYLVSHNITWSKPGMTTQQLNADYYACQKENTSDPQGGQSLIEEKATKQCMAARGYSFTESGF